MDNHDVLFEQLIEIRKEMAEGHLEVIERLTKLEGAVSGHTVADGAAQNRVSKLEERVERIERPLKWATGSLWLAGALSIVLGVYKVLQDTGIL